VTSIAPIVACSVDGRFTRVAVVKITLHIHAAS